ncbi:flagellar brake protein [Thalassotalea sp. LPB0316]|uniref:PilZ domain-containing protein n=1 Tax=Thalassotalea sp. LPB0316 TaxID=2769490 RepID=UPI0018666DCB|nr:PilZ domain-containing protein [Thalassotalea sp. LPB0316]QOL26981.1 flagellar brake protein [Thalassotalea sp. LPB0316]
MASQVDIDTNERLYRNVGLIQPGGVVTIDVTTPAGKRGKFRTTFIGFLPKRYVLIQMPDKNKLGNFAQYIYPDTTVTVRGLIEGHEGAVVAFVGVVKQTLQIPSRIIVLDFPTRVSLQSLRSAMRIDTDMPIKVGVDKEYWQAKMLDLSINGCQIAVPNAETLLLANDKSIAITIEDISGVADVKLNGQICNVKQQINDVSLGVKFKDDDKEKVAKLLKETVTLETQLR